jgi:hypothetical protein
MAPEMGRAVVVGVHRRDRHQPVLERVALAAVRCVAGGLASGSLSRIDHSREARPTPVVNQDDALERIGRLERADQGEQLAVERVAGQKDDHRAM